MRIEVCERRQLLSATVSGVKFLDKTADGFSADDIPLAGVPIDLFRDGGDKTFNFDAAPATTDDTLVATSTSAASTGAYSFADLRDGLYYLRERVPAGYTRTAGPDYYTFTVAGSQVVRSGGSVMLDDFTDPNPAEFAIVRGPASNLKPNPYFFQNTASAGTILGGQRDVEINVFKNLTSNSATVVTGTLSGQGTFGLGVNSLSAAQVILQYDGTDSSIANAQGLPQVDLTSAGATSGFRLAIAQWESTTAPAIEVVIDVASPGGTATLTRSIPTTSSAAAFDVDIPFADFTTTAGFSFAKATSVQFTINPVTDNDARATDIKLDALTLVDLRASGFDFGNNLSNPARLSGWVYVDANNDGVKDAAESPIAGVTVTLTGTDNLGRPANLSTVTDANGYYKFNGLPPGTYAVHETQPAGYFDGKDTIGAVALSRGGTTTDDTFSTIALQSGDNANANDFGELVPARISGWVYVDTSNDGVKDATESPIAGVNVTLTGSDYLGGAVSQSMATDANGYYKFLDLLPGTYTVHETQPAGYLDGKDTLGAVALSRGGTTANDTFSTIALQSGDNANANDFGELVPARISGWVYVDANNNGVKDSTEKPLAGVTITLTGSDYLGNPVNQSMATDANGYYKFMDLLPGAYAVHEVQSAGYVDGKDAIGAVALSRGGTAGNDTFSNIALQSGDNANANNFGEFGMVPTALSKRALIYPQASASTTTAAAAKSSSTGSLTGLVVAGGSTSTSKSKSPSATDYLMKAMGAWLF